MPLPDAVDGLRLRRRRGRDPGEPGRRRSDRHLPGEPDARVGADTLLARLTAHGITVSGIFTFTPEGDLVDFVSERYATEGERQVLKTWRARCDGHAQFDGVRVCDRMVGIWEEAGRAPFEYAHFQYSEVEYDVFSLY